MPRDTYEDYAPRPTQRREPERFTPERDRTRGQDFELFEEREVRVASGSGRPSRRRDHSLDSGDLVDSRGHRGAYEEDYVREHDVYRDEPRDIPVRSKTTVERETEREYYRSPSPPRMKRPIRPSMLRKQSSLDTFDRKPTIPRYVEREESGPLELRRDPPSGRYVERDYIEKVKEYPGRTRERETVRLHQRSRSRSWSSSSSSYLSDASTARTSKSQFPKRGKTRMPAKLVSRRAIIELGYPFEEEDKTIIIKQALGREHIEEVLQLSEKYRKETKTEHTDKIVEETHKETIYIPPPAPHYSSPIPHYSPPIVQHHHQVVQVPTPPPAPLVPYNPPSHPLGPEIIQVDPPRTPRTPRGPSTSTELVTTKTAVYEERYGPGRHHRSHSMGPTPRHIESSLAIAPIPAFPSTHRHRHDGRIVRVERIRDADYRRSEEGELVLYEKDAEIVEPVAAVRRDRKGPNPRAVRAMMRFVT